MDNCICGSPSYRPESRPGYVVTRTGREEHCQVPVAVCDVCGVIRQTDLPFGDIESYGKFYGQYPPGNDDYIYSGGALATARKNFPKLGLSGARRLLDIGCGSGAMVRACRDNGIEAWGCELARYRKSHAEGFVYYRRFEDIHFPTDHFDMVVSFHVLEHVMDPVAFLREAFRVTAQEGQCIIEIPNPRYEGHWKRNEHLWFFNREQLVGLMKRVGFVDLESIMREPDAKEERIVVRGRKPIQQRARLLLPPGVGDVYWPLVKIQSFFKREGVATPVDAYIAAPRAKKYDGHARSFPFLAMFPFLNSTGENRFTNPRDPIWHEAYLRQGRSIFEQVADCDWFITWNGHMRAGKALDALDPDLECNWHPPRFISLKEDATRDRAIREYGDYLVLYWIFAGTNGTILKHLSLENIAQVCTEACRLTNCRPILVGSRWDSDDKHIDELVRRLPVDTVDMRGKTSLEEVFGLMRGAKAVFGMNSGITIMAAEFGVKTVMVIHDYLFTGGCHRDFAWNIVPPDVRRKTFWAEYADQVDVASLANRVVSLVGEARQPSTRPAWSRPAHSVRGDIPHLGKPHSLPSILMDPPSEHVEDAAETKPREATVVCVFKSGGDFDIRYVANLKSMLDRHLTGPFRFVCLTDVPESLNGFETIPLIGGLYGWWSKIELFRPSQFVGKVVYFDLDTLILANVDDILALDSGFYALRPWNPRNRALGLCASGMMAWDGDIAGFVFDGFESTMAGIYRGDQAYLSHMLKRNQVECRFLQDFVPGIHSFKRECRSGPLSGSRIICFHGKPRLHECQEGWIMEAWR